MLYPIPKTCPYCKVDFVKHPHYASRYPKVICLNCRWCYEIAETKRLAKVEMRQEEERLLEMEKQRRAYFYWDKVGRPQGRDLEFWLQGEREAVTSKNI